jgi:hypothetical protein
MNKYLIFFLEEADFAAIFFPAFTLVLYSYFFYSLPTFSARFVILLVTILLLKGQLTLLYKID